MSGLSREALLSMIANLPVKQSVPPAGPVNAAGPIAEPKDDSKSGDFKAEFEKAMGGDFDFKGSFAYSGTFPQAPNPVLFVEGVGLIGLPLSERDAQLLINSSARAPYGHNDQTIVNPEVRDTWEIEPAKIVFKNPAWARFVQNQVLSTVTTHLGTGAAQTRCELYKLLLYQEGSHFHRHQDTAKSHGMFATIIIILPSMYTGGEVHVSHSSSYEVFDFSAQSLLSTVALAWYTDVFHEVKPVKSGYRLALSYNVIKDPTALSIPRLPDMSGASEELRRVLETWKARRYSTGNQELIAYILEHQYSTYDLDRGLASLKGSDAHRLVHIDEVAADLGFEVYLANLEYHLHGAADDDGHGYHKRGRYYEESDDDDDETPGMLEVYERTLQASHLVDLEGGDVGFSELKLKMAQLIPSDPFNGAEPDDTEYEGYMGNGAGELDQYYHRTVMIVVHEDDSLSAFTAGDPNGSYGFHRLKNSMTALSDTPTQDDIKLANVVIKHLQKNQKDVATTLLSYAVCWKDSAMWKRLAVWLNHELSMAAISEAWKSFGFEAIREILEPVVVKSKTFSEKMNWLNTFEGLVYPDERLAVRAWRVTQRTNALSTLKNPTVSDVAVIVKLSQEYGAGWFDTKIYPTIAKDNGMYSFWVSLSQELYKVKDTLPQPDAETAESIPACTSDALVDKCVQTATSLWEATVAAPYSGYYRPPNHNGNPQQVERIIQLVNLYISTDRVASCRPLFIDLLKKKPLKRDTFETIYKSLTVGLRETLEKNNLSICDAPFADIMQVLVGSYLHEILGAKPKPVNMRTVGCGCSDCKTLNAFLQAETPETQTLLLLKKQKDHIVGKLWLAKDLLEFDIIERGRPQPLVLKRSKAVIAARQWPRKQAEARMFLQSVGNDEIIGHLLGTRYADMLRAVEGTKRFVLPVNQPVPVDIAQVPTAEAGQVAGKKRKQTAVIDGPVIDLTSD